MNPEDGSGRGSRSTTKKGTRGITKMDDLILARIKKENLCGVQ